LQRPKRSLSLADNFSLKATGHEVSEHANSGNVLR